MAEHVHEEAIPLRQRIANVGDAMARWFCYLPQPFGIFLLCTLLGALIIAGSYGLYCLFTWKALALITPWLLKALLGTFVCFMVGVIALGFWVAVTT